MARIERIVRPFVVEPATPVVVTQGEIPEIEDAVLTIEASTATKTISVTGPTDSESKKAKDPDDPEDDENKPVKDIVFSEVSRSEKEQKITNPDDPDSWVKVKKMLKVRMTGPDGQRYQFNYSDVSADPKDDTTNQADPNAAKSTIKQILYGDPIKNLQDDSQRTMKIITPPSE